MIEYICWTALEKEGYGAKYALAWPLTDDQTLTPPPPSPLSSLSLQHYNEIVETRVRTDFNVPEDWKLIAQMPFGKPEGKPQEKTFKPIDERVKVLGKQ